MKIKLANVATWAVTDALVWATYMRNKKAGKLLVYLLGGFVRLLVRVRPGAVEAIMLDSEPVFVARNAPPNIYGYNGSFYYKLVRGAQGMFSAQLAAKEAISVACLTQNWKTHFGSRDKENNQIIKHVDIVKGTLRADKVTSVYNWVVAYVAPNAAGYAAGRSQFAYYVGEVPGAKGQPPHRFSIPATDLIFPNPGDVYTPYALGVVSTQNSFLASYIRVNGEAVEFRGGHIGGYSLEVQEVRYTVSWGNVIVSEGPAWYTVFAGDLLYARHARFTRGVEGEFIATTEETGAMWERPETVTLTFTASIPPPNMYIKLYTVREYQMALRDRRFGLAVFYVERLKASTTKGVSGQYSSSSSSSQAAMLGGLIAPQCLQVRSLWAVNHDPRMTLYFDYDVHMEVCDETTNQRYVIDTPLFTVVIAAMVRDKSYYVIWWDAQSNGPRSLCCRGETLLAFNGLLRVIEAVCIDDVDYLLGVISIDSSAITGEVVLINLVDGTRTPVCSSGVEVIVVLFSGLLYVLSEINRPTRTYAIASIDDALEGTPSTQQFSISLPEGAPTMCIPAYGGYTFSSSVDHTPPNYISRAARKAAAGG